MSRYEIHREHEGASFISVGTGISLPSSYLLQRDVSYTRKLSPAHRAALYTLSAFPADIVSVSAQGYWWHHVLRADRTLQVAQKRLVEFTGHGVHVVVRLYVKVGSTAVNPVDDACVEAETVGKTEITGEQILTKEMSYVNNKKVKTK